MRRNRTAFVISCEHGGNQIPVRYRDLFRGQARLLASHRSHDIGALVLARHLAQRLNAPLFYSKVSRLLIDLNRSPHHKNLFSEFTRRMTEIDRHTINARYYQPYRTEIERCIAHLIGAGEKVIHVSVHSFTPRLHGHVRTADIGLLYDPGRAFESKVCDLWKAYFTNTEPTLRVKRNYPYRGTADGLTKYLRTRFAAGRYAGIELEINQRIPLGSAAAWRRLQRTITDTLVCLR